MLRTLLLLILPVFLAPPAVLAAPLNADTRRAVDAAVTAEMRREHVPGVAVAVIRGGEVVLATGYGLANVEHDVPVTPETIFQSGSVGKQFTSALVMLEVEGGKLGLDDPVTKHFADAPPSWHDITVRHLLTHTSGLSEYTDEQPGDGAPAFDPRRDLTEADMVRAAYGGARRFPPGERWEYCNTGYVLLGAIIRRAGGRYYGDELHDRIFEPLGMKTARIISEEDIVPHRAAGYRLVHGELKNQEWVAPSLNTTADGSLYLSLDDMIAWDRGLRAGAILKPESWKEIYTPVRLRSGRTYPYGFGWSVDEWRGHPWLHHTGSWQGFKTIISRYLAADLTVIVLANLAQASPRRIADAVVSVVETDAPRLAPVTPIADEDPAATAKVRAILDAARKGSAGAAKLLAPATNAAELATDLTQRVAAAGELASLQLVFRAMQGDDVTSEYLARYPTMTLRVSAVVTPKGRYAEFGAIPD